jgi:hypothetical protein
MAAIPVGDCLNSESQVSREIFGKSGVCRAGKCSPNPMQRKRAGLSVEDPVREII